MRLPRMTVRRWMGVVAVAAVILAVPGRVYLFVAIYYPWLLASLAWTFYCGSVLWRWQQRPWVPEGNMKPTIDLSERSLLRGGFLRPEGHRLWDRWSLSDPRRRK